MCILRLEPFDQLQAMRLPRARDASVLCRHSSLNSDAKRRIRRSRVSCVSLVASVMCVPHRVHILRLRCDSGTALAFVAQVTYFKDVHALGPYRPAAPGSLRSLTR